MKKTETLALHINREVHLKTWNLNLNKARPAILRQGVSETA
jgi:hypothetical protein